MKIAVLWEEVKKQNAQANMEPVVFLTPHRNEVKRLVFLVSPLYITSYLKYPSVDRIMQATDNLSNMSTVVCRTVGRGAMHHKQTDALCILLHHNMTPSRTTKINTSLIQNAHNDCNDGQIMFWKSGRNCPIV